MNDDNVLNIEELRKKIVSHYYLAQAIEQLALFLTEEIEKRNLIFK